MPTSKRLLPAFILLLLATASCGAAGLPSLTVASHHDKQTVYDSAVTLSGTASDPAKVASIAVSLNRGPWTAAVWNGSLLNPQENASWSIRLELSEGANIIVVNATNAENESATLTLLMEYSIRSSDNGGVILAVGVMLAIIILIALLAFRVKGAPPTREEEEGQVVESHPEGTAEDEKKLLEEKAEEELLRETSEERLGMAGEKGARENK